MQFRLQIVTQQRTIFDRPVTSLTMPGEEGYFGVLANHAPIIAILKEGHVDLRETTETKRFHITGGFFEMNNNVATLLVDSQTGLNPQED